MANIKQIQIGSITYDIEALHFVLNSGGTTLSTPSDWKSYIDNAVSIGLEIVIDDKSAYGDYPDTPADSTTMGKLYLVQLSGQTTSGAYTEFITVRTGDPGNYHYEWEKIGTTAADLTDYAKKTEAAKPGTYTTPAFTLHTGNPSVTSGTYTSVTTSSAGQEIAHVEGGTVQITVNEGISAAGATTIDGSNFTFTGTAHHHTVTGEASTKIDNHSFTPAGSISGQLSVPNHTHSIGYGTTSVINGLSKSTHTVMEGATVNSSGVLSFSTTSAITGITAGFKTVVTSVTEQAAGSTTLDGSNLTFTGTAASLAHTQVAAASSGYKDLAAYTLNLTTQNATAGGSISGTVSIASHTHSITNGTTTIYNAGYVSIDVPIGNHTHTVNLPNHTHGASHTHTVTIPAITTTSS